MLNEVGEENSDKIFFDFLAKAYASFLAGTDGDSTQLEEDLAASFGVITFYGSFHVLFAIWLHAFAFSFVLNCATQIACVLFGECDCAYTILCIADMFSEKASGVQVS